MTNEGRLRRAIRRLIEQELEDLKDLEELTGTGAADGFGTPYAFQGDSKANKKKREENAETIDGFNIVGEGRKRRRPIRRNK